MNRICGAFLIFSGLVRGFSPVIEHRTNHASSALSMGIRDAIVGRFRKKKKVEVVPIEVGQSLPDVDVQKIAFEVEGKEIDDEIGEAPLSAAMDEAVSINDVVGGSGKAILVGMPGAFTTVCTGVHLPGYIANEQKLNELGVQNIAIVTTNDKWVNSEWGKSVGIGETNITMCADGDGELVRQLGLVEDQGFGLGERSKRFAMILDDGVVEYLVTDEGMDDCIFTSAERLVEILTPEPELAIADYSEDLDLDASTIAIAGGILLVVCLMSFGGGGDHSTAATSAAPAVQSVAPAVKSQAGTSFGLLEMYGN